MERNCIQRAPGAVVERFHASAMENRRDQGVLVEGNLLGGGSVEECGGALWQLVQCLHPGGRVGIMGQWVGSMVWWRGPRPGREQGCPPSGSLPSSGDGKSAAAEIREALGSSLCTAGCLLPCLPQLWAQATPAILLPGALAGRARWGDPGRHAGQGWRTCWLFLGKLLEM